MPVENVLEQNAIADSLIDTNPETNGSLGTLGQVFERTEESNTADEFGLYPEDYPQEQEQELEAPELEQSERETPEALEELREYTEQQTRQQDHQPEQVQQPDLQAGQAQFDSVIEQFGLNDPKQGQALASEFLAAFPGIPSDAVAGMDAGQFQRTMNYTALSLGSMYDSVNGDLSRLQAFDVAQAGQRWGNDFLASFGLDSRVIDFDAQTLGQAIFEGGLNILRTYDAMGRNADVRQLNSPEAAMHFYEKFARAFGHDGPIDRMEAVKIADVFAKAILGPVQRIAQQPVHRATSRTQQQSRSSGRRSAMPRMKTNQDIFDADVLERIAMEKAL